MKLTRVLSLLFISLYFFSCKPQQQIHQYLETYKDTSGTGSIKSPDLIIQKNDLLQIFIMSLATKPEAENIYNQPAGTAAGAPGYLVDNNGDIFHHRLGLIHAEGLTKNQLADEIKKRLTQPAELLKDPTVVVRLTNFKVTVLGQVGREGEIKIPGERLTILEAVGLAGGINDFGKKNELKIIREANGKRETALLDLTSKDIFDSPYYYMVQNDVLIIPATNQKFKDAEQAKTMQKISFAFTLVTVAATLANIFIRN
ncbi:MAG: polysaccharide biosynthesis/export family protein [Chitinophagaceae bacterium]